MGPFRSLSRQVQVYFVLFASLASAALRNVTVDDAVLTGAVVPQYLPSPSNWNTGNNCTGCYVKPDPSLAYNGTWHDTTYSPTNGFSQAIELAFTGSALYIFFIMANNVTDATTFTDVEFVLDGGVAVSTYVHTPGATTDYQYNVPVYVNESLAFAQHNMMIQPVNSGNNVLILFDYLIYTTDTSTSSGENIGAIVGGTVGGVAALVLLIVSLLCYRRHERRNSGRPLAEEGVAMELPLLYTAMAPTSSADTTPLTRSIKPASGPPIVILEPPSLPATTTPPPSSGALPSTNTGLIEEVGLLRDEVARLRDLHEAPPPGYS